MKKYEVTRIETLTWIEEFEAENEEHLQDIIDDFDWELDIGTGFEVDCTWREINND
jgi:hypothetical protein